LFTFVTNKGARVRSYKYGQVHVSPKEVCLEFNDRLKTHVVRR